jgi:hypothetical protein
VKRGHAEKKPFPGESRRVQELPDIAAACLTLPFEIQLYMQAARPAVIIFAAGNNVSVYTTKMVMDSTI